MIAEEFAQMVTAETEDYELVDGKLIPLPSTTPLHNIIKGKIIQITGNYFDRNPIGGAISSLDCRISSDTVRRLDVSIFLGNEWEHLDMDRNLLPFAPAIAVEVLSPFDQIGDMNRRFREYLGAGSREVWLLDHTNRELHVRTKLGIRVFEGSDVLDSPLLPGFSVNLADLLAGR